MLHHEQPHNAVEVRIGRLLIVKYNRNHVVCGGGVGLRGGGRARGLGVGSKLGSERLASGSCCMIVLLSAEPQEQSVLSYGANCLSPVPDVMLCCCSTGNKHD